MNISSFLVHLIALVAAVSLVDAFEDEQPQTSGLRRASLDAKDEKRLYRRLQLPPAQGIIPNIGYLFTGYNIMEGNPIDSSTNVDPGFTVQIFQPDIDFYVKTPDGRFMQPPNITVLQCEGCDLSAKTTIVNTADQYIKTLDTKVSAGVGFSVPLIVTGRFKASTGYQETKDRMTTKNEISMETEASCCSYTAEQPNLALPPYSPNFQIHLDALNAKETALSSELGENEAVNITDFDYMIEKFVEEFGTHYVKKLSMGSFFGVQSFMTNQTKKRLEKKGTDIELSASLSIFGDLFSVDSSFTDEKQSTIDTTFNKHVSKKTLYSRGSKPPANGDVNSWLSDTKNNPAPIETELVRIDNLPGFSPGVKKIISGYLDDYCENMRRSLLFMGTCDENPLAKPTGPFNARVSTTEMRQQSHLKTHHYKNLDLSTKVGDEKVYTVEDTTRVFTGFGVKSITPSSGPRAWVDSLHRKWEEKCEYAVNTMEFSGKMDLADSVEILGDGNAKYGELEAECPKGYAIARVKNVWHKRGGESWKSGDWTWTFDCAKYKGVTISDYAVPVAAWFVSPLAVQAGEINGCDCFQGTAADTIAWCHANDNAKNCCKGRETCGWSASKTVTVCKDSCNGAKACRFGKHTELFIGMGSCHAWGACNSFAGASIGSGSCIGRAACQGFAGDSIGDDSCTANEACNKFAGSSIGNDSCTAERDCFKGTEDITAAPVGAVQAGEINGGDCFQGTAANTIAWCHANDNAKNCCKGRETCGWSASKTVTVCKDSCIGAKACRFATKNKLVVGMGSCHAWSACFRFAGDSIGSGSCIGNAACRGFAGDSIGDDSCTANEACDGGTEDITAAPAAVAAPVAARVAARAAAPVAACVAAPVAAAASHTEGNQAWSVGFGKQGRNKDEVIPWNFQCPPGHVLTAVKSVYRGDEEKAGKDPTCEKGFHMRRKWRFRCGYVHDAGEPEGTSLTSYVNPKPYENKDFSYVAASNALPVGFFSEFIQNPIGRQFKMVEHSFGEGVDVFADGSIKSSGPANVLEGILDHTCDAGHAMVGFWSNHLDTATRDRIYGVLCSPATNIKLIGEARWSFESILEDSYTFQCEPDYVLIGVFSTYDAVKKDRVWKIQCKSYEFLG